MAREKEKGHGLGPFHYFKEASVPNFITEVKRYTIIYR